MEGLLAFLGFAFAVLVALAALLAVIWLVRHWR